LLGPDEALVMTGRWPECRFANVSLWNRYLQTYDYAHRPASRNRANTTFYTIDPRGLVGGPDLDQRVDVMEWQHHVTTTQNTLRVLLLVPLGALAMSILRSIVGLRTFGMFMPMLIALAMTATGLVWGTAFLAGIVCVALVSRIWIKRLYLQLVARVAFILTLVVILMTVLMYVGDSLALPTEGVGAFPFVIMTMIVERISVSLEEEGWRNTLTRVGTTILSVYITYAVIQAKVLQTFLLVFPEMLLIILGLQIAIGKYTGYRFVELFRFRELANGDGGER